ncbi:tubulin folding cofactor A [Phyllostomus discolor]|uniref:Tubulin-specific chaperone A n=1 Tax=Phyllostomus discolor TaxID=89673 RepID=A0A834BEM0_9CHIR|nr:tubulin folding cofactor A [Phyllostomus discolor]
MADPRVRQIKIKTGVVKRLAKEKMMYEKEAKQQEEKIEKMKAEDGENYAIKKQAEILQESRMMIPDCQRRLEAAYADLLQILVSKDFSVLCLNFFQSDIKDQHF